MKITLSDILDLLCDYRDVESVREDATVEFASDGQALAVRNVFYDERDEKIKVKFVLERRR